MPRVMKHVKGGIEFTVRTRDEHPPPHIHVEHLAEGWEIKVAFSYVENTVSTYQVKHLGGKLPTLARLNAIVLEIMKSRRECRDVWWRHIQDAGLENQRVVICKGMAAQAAASVADSFLVLTAIYTDAIESMLFNANITGKCP